jgi:hypothetical protein
MGETTAVDKVVAALHIIAAVGRDQVVLRELADVVRQADAPNVSAGWDASLRDWIVKNGTTAIARLHWPSDGNGSPSAGELRHALRALSIIATHGGCDDLASTLAAVARDLDGRVRTDPQVAATGAREWIAIHADALVAMLHRLIRRPL